MKNKPTKDVQWTKKELAEFEQIRKDREKSNKRFLISLPFLLLLLCLVYYFKHKI